MGRELINRITRKKDGIYSKSNRLDFVFNEMKEDDKTFKLEDEEKVL